VAALSSIAADQAEGLGLDNGRSKVVLVVLVLVPGDPCTRHGRNREVGLLVPVDVPASGQGPALVARAQVWVQERLLYRLQERQGGRNGLDRSNVADASSIRRPRKAR
jgi:hypothetical protein